MSFLTKKNQKNNNQAVDFDGHYGNQCMDLANQYRRELTGLNPDQGINLSYAYQVFQQPEGFMNSATPYDRIFNDANDPNQVPKNGDIIVWSKEFNGWAGHIAIVTDAKTSNFQVLEQNAGNGDGQGADDNAKLSRYADYANVLGWLRITEPNPNQEESKPTQPNDPINKEYGYKLLESMKSNQIIDDNQLNNWLRPRLDVHGAISSIQTIIELFEGKNSEIVKLTEQNSGLARQVVDSKNDYVNALSGKAEAESVAQSHKAIADKLYTEINDTQIGHKSTIAELRASIDTSKQEIKDLKETLVENQKIVVKQGAIMNSKPETWKWLEAWKGLNKSGVVAFLATFAPVCIAYLSSPQLAQFIQSTGWSAVLIPVIAMIIGYLKTLKK